MLEKELAKATKMAENANKKVEQKLKDEEFPIENFRENAQKRVKLGIILNKLIEEHELKADEGLTIMEIITIL